MSMTKALYLSSLVAAAAFTGTLQAQSSESDPVYGALMGKYAYPDADRDARFGLGVNLLVGIPLSERINLEVGGFSYGAERESDGEYDFHHGLGLDVSWELTGGNFRPLLLVGAGATAEDVQGEVNLAPMANLGTGFIWYLPATNLALRGDVRYSTVFNDDISANTDLFGDVHFNFGMQFLWSGQQPPAPSVIVAQPVSPMDSDGDLVMDAQDACPNTPPNTAVDVRGCPLDADGDGVVDAYDRCPNTPAGAKVDAQGCPADADGDGVPNNLDQCPDTATGFRVDAKGCVIQQTVALNSVGFELGSSNLTFNAKRVLDDVAKTLRGQPSLQVEVGGHTDSQGSAEYNLDLSKKRALSVRQYLIEKGIDGARLNAEGYGEFYPVASNDTAAGRERNRRVEFKIEGR